ncbi:Phosphate regulon sensor protein PhoR (SphS) [hydrothermal vent metagenome]|uniref:Phosphate regulon sensor protein PhoR n=1 Tax=hydrothermal vent metagenome TaxID=652676 RepID=A0A3B1BKM7_9ZZZZ
MVAKEFWQFLVLGLIAILIGVVAGHVKTALLIFMLACLGWYFLNMIKLVRWLEQGKKYSPPVSQGLWGHIFTEIYHMQQRKRRRNKKLVKLLSRFRESTAALPEGVIVLREQGEIEWWNDKAHELLGLKYPQDVERRLTNLLRNPEVMDYLRKMDTETPVRFPSPVDEQKILSLKVVPYGNRQKLVVVRDVTLNKRVEEMQRDFVANISHELRTPLTVINGYLENLLDDMDGMDSERLQHTFRVMQQQAIRMRQLTDDLTTLSNVDNEKIGPRNEVVNVPQMLSSLQEEAQILSGDSNHTFVVEVDSELFLRGDSKELDSVFTNLMVNAINYTPAGGAIRVSWYRDDSGAHFEVNDTGIGIAPYHVERLTERFYRVDVARSRHTGGSGLGLAIVTRALKRHQANLRIDSEIGRGSAFICDFPEDILVEKSDIMPPAPTSLSG